MQIKTDDTYADIKNYLLNKTIPNTKIEIEINKFIKKCLNFQMAGIATSTNTFPQGVQLRLLKFEKEIRIVTREK